MAVATVHRDSGLSTMILEICTSQYELGPGYLSFLDSCLVAAAPLVTLLIYLARAIEQHAKDLDRERQHHNRRACVCAGENVPSPLLQRPYGVYKNWVDTCAPEKEGGRPREIREKLVMQGPGAKQADGQGAQHDSHSEGF